MKFFNLLILLALSLSIAHSDGEFVTYNCEIREATNISQIDYVTLKQCIDNFPAGTTKFTLHAEKANTPLDLSILTAELSKQTRITDLSLHLQGNSLDGEDLMPLKTAFHELTRLASLRLYLQDNKISTVQFMDNMFPIQIAFLNDLYLELSDNDLQGDLNPLYQSLYNLHNLTVLTIKLSNNKSPLGDLQGIQTLLFNNELLSFFELDLQNSQVTSLEYLIKTFEDGEMYQPDGEDGESQDQDGEQDGESQEQDGESQDQDGEQDGESQDQDGEQDGESLDQDGEQDGESLDQDGESLDQDGEQDGESQEQQEDPVEQAIVSRRRSLRYVPFKRLPNLKTFVLNLSHNYHEEQKEYLPLNLLGDILSHLDTITTLSLDISGIPVEKDFHDLKAMFIPIKDNLFQLSLGFEQISIDSLEFVGESFSQLIHLNQLRINLANQDKQFSEIDDFSKYLANLTKLQILEISFAQSLPNETDLSTQFFPTISNLTYLNHLYLNFNLSRNIKGLDHLKNSLSNLERLEYLNLQFEENRDLDIVSLGQALNSLSQIKGQVIISLKSSFRSDFTDGERQEIIDDFFYNAFAKMTQLKKLHIDFSHNTSINSAQYLANAFRNLDELVDLTLIMQDSKVDQVSSLRSAFRNCKRLQFLVIDCSRSQGVGLEWLDVALRPLSELKHLTINFSINFMTNSQALGLYNAFEQNTELEQLHIDLRGNGISQVTWIKSAFIYNTNLQIVSINVSMNKLVTDLSPVVYAFIHTEKLHSLQLYLTSEIRDGETASDIDFSPYNSMLNGLQNQLDHLQLDGYLLSGLDQSNATIQRNELYNLKVLTEKKARFQFSQGGATLQQNCAHIDSICDSCMESSDNCTTCQNFRDGENCQNCLSGYFENPDEFLGICQECVLENCSDCSSRTQCTECSEGFFLQFDGTCADTEPELCSSIDQCKSCPDGENCELCEDGFFVQFDGSCADTEPVQCTKVENCQSCPDEKTCELCNFGFSLQEDGSCLNIEPAQCTEVDNCISCPDGETCIQCEEQYDLQDDGSCSLRDSCPSIKNCLVCPDEKTCETCAQGYDLNKKGGCDEHKDKKSNTGTILIIVFSVLGSLILIGLIAYFVMKKKKQQQQLDIESGEYDAISMTEQQNQVK